jgi:hypothetical protein
VQDGGHLLVFAVQAVHDAEWVVDVGVAGLVGLAGVCLSGERYGFFHAEHRTHRFP